jgi:DNA-binding NarL/FixJ family response regulator
MGRRCCLAGIERDKLPVLSAALKGTGEKSRAVKAALDVRALAELHPDLVIGDIDNLDVDALELVRQIRFVLPSCVIAIYSDDLRKSWGLECHMAGANCVLSKASTVGELTTGIADALSSGCYTDPRLVV